VPSQGEFDLGAAPLGARQVDRRRRRRGGGYQETCTVSAIAPAMPTADPRMAELRMLTLQPVWHGLAARIGFDAFLVAWQYLTSDDSWLDAHHRVSLPSFRQYQRLQRNLVIGSLLADGCSHAEIRAHVKAKLGVDVAPSHLQKIVRKLRFKE
jgi:hypothetical protein